jgi:hypothetical protein
VSAWRWLVVLLFGALAASAAWGEPQQLPLAAARIQEGASAREVPAHSALPYRWDRSHRGSGSGHFDFTLPAFDATQPQSLYLPRVGNTFRVLLNGAVIHSDNRHTTQWMNTVHLPRQVDLPRDVAPGDRLTVEFQAMAGADGGLSGVVFGSKPEIATLYARNVN